MTTRRLGAPHTVITSRPERWTLQRAHRSWTAWRMRLISLDRASTARVEAAGLEFGVAPELIASVLADEQVRLDIFDRIQDALMRLGMALPSGWSSFFLKVLERLSRRSVDGFSLGLAQMKPGTLAALGRLGYLDVPPTRRGQRRLLLDPVQAPRLVAACLRATADHWAAHGVQIQHRPEILGTLYSLGFTGPRGVHGRPEASARGDLIARHAEWLSGVPSSQSRVSV